MYLRRGEKIPGEGKRGRESNFKKGEKPNQEGLSRHSAQLPQHRSLGGTGHAKQNTEGFYVGGGNTMRSKKKRNNERIALHPATN